MVITQLAQKTQIPVTDIVVRTVATWVLNDATGTLMHKDASSSAVRIRGTLSLRRRQYGGFNL